MHAAVARSKFRSQMPKTLHVWGTFGIVLLKKRTRLWCEVHFEVKMLKLLMLGARLKVEMFKKCTLLWREAHFQVKILNTACGCGAKHIWKSKC